MKKFKIKSGDRVRVITGEYKTKTGKVLKIDRDKDRVVVEGINIKKRHYKPSSDRPQGGIVEKEASLHISNVLLVDSKGNVPTRVGFEIRNGKKVRISKKSKEEI